MKPVVFVTGNEAKAKYYEDIIGYPIERHAIDLPELQSTDLEVIAEDKARRAYEIIKSPVLVEDVGLYFNALGDLPGPFIKFFLAQKDGLEKLCRLLDGFNDRSAYTKIVLAYFDGQNVTLFSGTHTGSIAASPRGNGGFGYDPIWCIDGYGGRTRAELTPEEDLKTYASIRPIDALHGFFGAGR